MTFKVSPKFSIMLSDIPSSRSFRYSILRFVMRSIPFWFCSTFNQVNKNKSLEGTRWFGQETWVTAGIEPFKYNCELSTSLEVKRLGSQRWLVIIKRKIIDLRTNQWTWSLQRVVYLRLSLSPIQFSSFLPKAEKLE